MRAILAILISILSAGAHADNGNFNYTYRVEKFADWMQKAPLEAQALNLYKGFVEPTVIAVKYGKETPVVEKMMVYIGRAQVTLDKPAAQINLAQILKIDAVRGFNAEIKHVPLAQNQLMTAVAGRGKVPNFQWCAPDTFDKPNREKNISFLTPKDRPNWCSDTAHSLCLESCYVFNTGYSAAVSTANLNKNPDERKDYGIAFQSELRIFATEAESGSPVSLKELTGVPTAVRGGIEQNIFYFNQLFQYGKMLAVLQDDPANPNRTVATVYFAMGIKERTWNLNSQVPAILLGQSRYFNTHTGAITDGLPVFTQIQIKAIANLLGR